MPPSAKRVVLELMSAGAPAPAPVAQLVAAAGVLGIAENNIRVTLARLVASGTIEPSARGEYRLGKAAQAMTRQVTSWRDLERQVRRWDGGWACVHVGELPRSDRGALRRRERALRLLGFRPLHRTVEVRPDNLDGGVAGLRERGVALGIEPGALVFRASDFDPATEARARALWDGERLSASYAQTIERIERWLVTVTELAPRAAAREAFLFGGDVLRKILFDPRLPEPLVDVAQRRALVEAAKRLDVVGRRLWARLFGLPQGLVVTEEDRRGELA